MVVMHIQGGSVDGWNEWYEPAIFRAVAVLTAWDSRPQTEGELQQLSGLALGRRRTLRSAQGTRTIAYCALRGEIISPTGRVSQVLTGRTGDYGDGRRHSQHALGALSGRYAVRPRLRAHGFSSKGGRDR